MNIRSWAAATALICCGLALAACGNSVDVSQPATAAGSAQGVAGFTTFPDMPMPSGSEIDVDGTLIFGTGDAWFGRLMIKTSHGTGEMFDFYRRGLPGFGWEEVTAVRAAVSVLTYTRQERVATIQIEGRTIRGSQISITVSPHGTPRPAATAAPAAQIAPVHRVQ